MTEIMVLANGFTCKLQLYGPINCVHGLCFKPSHSCSHVGWGFNLSKKFALLHKIDMARASVMIGSTRMSNSLVSKMVVTVESGLSCDDEEEEEEEEGKGESDRRESVGFEARMGEQILPPWGGNSEVCEGSGLEPGGSGLSKTCPEDKAGLSVDCVHFLEEVDEEILSKRVLVLSRTNKTRSALELLRSMELSGLRPDLHACNSLLSCLLRNGLLDDAMRLFKFMKAEKIATGHSYSLVLKAVADARGFDAALKMFGEMEEEFEVECGFDTVVYNTMISVCGRMNRWLEALRLWRSMKDNHLSGTRVTYSVLVSTFVRCGRNELALDVYSEMVQRKFEPGSDTMQAVIGACTREGKWDFALGIFQSMLKRGLKPNAVACNALINSLGKAGEIKLTFKVFKIMKSLGNLPDAYTWNALLGALYRANRHDDALQLFESIKQEQDLQLNLHLYNVALISCSKLGLWDRALQLLWQMESNGVTASTASYNLVISACETARKPDVAVQVYEHMVHQKCVPDTFTHLLLIRVCIWGSLWSEVEEILNRAAPDASIYNAIIQGMCLRGKIESAKKLYTKMRNFGLQPDGKTRALMLQNLRKDSTRHKYTRRPFRRGKRTNLSSL